MQHDIGNDLQLIQQYSDIIDSSLGESPTETRKLINSLNAVIHRTGGLLKAFTLKEDTHYTGFVGFLEDIINNARLTYPDAEIRLVKSDDVNEVPANIGRLLPVVFENLVRNSIQHAQSNVKIVIEVTATPYQIKIRFSDNGLGIPNEFRDVIFKKRLSTETGGFGLYLSQQIINAYNGEIELEDTEIGTSFLIRLPLSN